MAELCEKEKQQEVLVKQRFVNVSQGYMIFRH